MGSSDDGVEVSTSIGPLFGRGGCLRGLWSSIKNLSSVLAILDEGNLVVQPISVWREEGRERRFGNVNWG